MFWIIVAVLLWGFLHSFLASLRVKEWSQQAFGLQLIRFYRLVYNFFAGISFLAVLALLFFVPDHPLYLVPVPWSLFMVAGEILAAVTLLIGFRQTNAWEFIGIQQIEKGDCPSQLTTSGLYRIVRHPLYTAGLVFIWLVPLMTTNILAINIALTIYVAIGASLEERKLLREFGQDYADYCAVTPMFIPLIKGNKNRRESS